MDCPAPRFRADYVEAAVWGWVVTLLNDPVALFEGYHNSQRKLHAENEATHEQMRLIDQQIAKQQSNTSSRSEVSHCTVTFAPIHRTCDSG